MPMFAQGQDPLDAGATLSPERGAIGAPEPDRFTPAPGIASTVGAAFRQGNSLVSVMDAWSSQSPDKAFDAEHNPLETIKGTWAEARPELFLGSPNEAVTRAMIAKGERENRDRETLAAAGWPGVVASFGAGLLDPTMAIVPFAGLGGSALRTAGRMAALGALQSSASEAALRSSQVTRTNAESLHSIASATLLMGVLGGAIGALAPGERAAAAQGLDEMRGAAPAAAAGEAESLSAAASDTRSMQQVATGLPRQADALSPAARVITGESVSAKRATTELVETSRRFEQEAEGAPKSLWGGAIETVNRLEKNKFEVAAGDTLRDLWAQHYYEGEAPRFATQRSALAELFGQTEGGKLSFREFKEAVYDAAYSGDEHAVKEVADAAKAIRRDVLAPLAERAKMTLSQDGTPLLDPDTVAPKGDKSFVPRMWDHPTIVAKRNEFADVITNWLQGEQQTKAAAKERIATLNDRHNEILGHVQKLEGRLETIKNRIGETGARLDERGQEARQAVPREEALKARAGEIKAGISELQEFIATMRGELRDPAALERLDDLEKEVTALRSEAAPMSAAELARIEKEEVGSILTGDLRQAAEIAIGKRNAPKEPSFTSWMAKEGGVFDERGDLASMIGKNSVPGLIRKQRNMDFSRGELTRSLDDWGERFYAEAPEAFPNGRPTPAEVLDIIGEAHNGNPPEWFLQNYGGAKARDLNRMADHLRDAFEAGGVEPGSLREAAEAMSGRTPRVLERLQEKARAAGDLPGAEADLQGRYQARRDLQGLVERGLADQAKRAAVGSRENARAAEAGVAANRAQGRLGILSERMNRQQIMQDLLETARQNAESEAAKVRASIEEEVGAWKGKSSREAISALEAREEAERVRGLKEEAGLYEGQGKRLTSADRPVDRAVRRILESDRDLSRQELFDRSQEIIDRILGTPDGRMPYDIASGGPKVGFSGQSGAPPRGSLHARDFAIPTGLVKDFVVRDMEHVVAGYLRTMLPDIELTKRFGDVDMTSVIKSIREEYNAKIAALGTGAAAEKAAQKLHDAAEADIRDVAAMRDRLRNVYGWTSDATGRQAHNIARDLRNWTSLASLGGAAVNSFTDFGMQAVFRYGLTNTFREQWAPFIKSLMGASGVAGMARREAREMGIGVETALGLARHNFSDVVENYKPGNKFSRGVAWAADRLHIANMLGPWTDYAKIAAFVPAQAEFGRAAARIAAGEATAKDLARMADASIDIPMAKRIAAEIAKNGQTVGGVRFANAGAWEDAAARRVFETAMTREVDILVATPGHGDKPLWLSSAVGSVVGQFKSFSAGAHERVFISNLQKRDADTVGGVVTALGLGAMSYALYSLGSGQKPSDRPQDWVKEAIDRASLTGWIGEVGKVTAKLSAGRVDPYRLIGADRPLTRRSDNSGLAELLGPAYSIAEGAALAGKHAASGDFQGSDLHRLRKAAPLQNLTGLRKLLDDVEDGANNAFGLKPIHRTNQLWQ